MGEVAVGSGGAGGASAAMVSLIRPPPGNYYILVSTLSAPPAGTAAVLNVNAWGMWQALGLTVLAPNPTPTPARVARPSTTVCAALAAAPATASFWSTPLLGPLTGLAVVLVAAGVVVVAATLTAVAYWWVAAVATLVAAAAAARRRRSNTHSGCRPPSTAPAASVPVRVITPPCRPRPTPC